MNANFTIFKKGRTIRTVRNTHLDAFSAATRGMDVVGQATEAQVLHPAGVLAAPDAPEEATPAAEQDPD